MSISAEAFGVLPDIYNVQISPDGTKILTLKNIDGKMVLSTRALEGSDVSENLIPLAKGQYNWAAWASNDRIIASYRFAGQENRGRNVEVKMQRRLLSMHWDGTNIINPNRFGTSAWSNFKPREPQNQDSIVDILKDDPDHILLQMDVKKANKNAVFKVNIKSRRRTQVINSRKTVDWWMTDQNHIIRYSEGRIDVKGFNKVRHIAQYRKSKRSKWIKLFDYNEIEDRRPFYFEGFTDDPSIIYITQDDDNNRRGLFTYNVDTGQVVDKIAGSDDFDIYEVSFNDQKELEHYAYYDERPYFIRFDKDGQKLEQLFSQKFPNEVVTIEGKSKDKQKVIINVSSPRNYGSFYLVDVASEEFTPLGSNYSKLDSSKLSDMIPITYQARDGMDISGYLSFPVGKDPKNLPTIIMPHGGPMTSDGWGFDYWTQFLTTRGYAVLQMNYRGSTGYGEDFRMAGYHEWGGKMLDDINDGSKWMIEQSYADPDRICIMGGSYGGYAALQGVVEDESLYKCAVAFAPVTDLESFMESIENIVGFKSYENYIESDDWTYEEASPLQNISKMNLPVLLIHGEKDLSVDVRQSRRYFDKMKNAGKNINYIELKNGDHYLSNQNQRVQFLTEIEKFLAKNL
ncbi:MAG: S9 family peptidase [Kordiimonadaceae bacterium]|nr:S9 family peptidase [Kordiimonadaceae bacterium]